MLEVTCRESYRDFDIRVGELKVGMVRVFSGTSCQAYNFRQDENGKMHTQWLDNGFPTLRAATNRILRHLGYGDTKKVKSEPVTGVRAG